MTQSALSLSTIPAPTGGSRRLSLRLASAPKILLYSHDTFGLGNIRRTLLLAEALREEYPGSAILIVTGSPVIHAFRVPDGIDYIKLPCLDRVAADNYRPKFLAEWSAEVTKLRRAILRRSVLGFAPDLLIVDKRASGIDGELVETIRALRRSRRQVKVVLGIRDILDEPIRTRQSLKQTGCLELAAQYYDEVWIYGERCIFDAVAEYGFPETVARKTKFCGYLKRPTRTVERKSGPPRVPVTTGSGGDGTELIRTYLEGLLTLPRSVALQTTVVFGPEMPHASRAVLMERFGSMVDVYYLDFDADMTQRYAEADVVVSMAGYNTVCELLSSGQHAVLVPRAEPVSEQLHRECRLRVVGEGPERGGLERLIDRLHLGDRVELAGSATHDVLPGEYATVHAVVVPSVEDSTGDRDGLPNVILEAMACGRPVVASDIGATGSAVMPGRTGLLVPPGDSDSLATALGSLAGNTQAISRMGAAARVEAERRFELAGCTGRLEGVLRSAYA